MFQKREIVLTVLLICFMFFSSGCSVVMAVKQPEHKNLNVLEKGTSRAEVVAEIGAPLFSEEKDGKKRDVFAFKQGYGKGNKASRAAFHAVADVFSFGLWEVIGTPAEAIASGRNMKIEVIYDQDEKVEQVNYIDTKPKKEQKQKEEQKS